MDFIEVTGKTVDEAVTNALIELQTTSDKVEYEVVEEGSKGIFGIGSKPAIIKARRKETIEDIANDFITEVCNAMGIAAKADILVDGQEMDINLIGDDMGVLIGKRGQTLDSLQYLVSLVVNKKSDTYYKVRLDSQNYRARRKETLENLARNIAFKVKRTKRPVSLEPMNPYERRIIHSALQNDHFVKTESKGEDPNRYVVISLKKN